eukprot:3022659-Pyramimonas_sp.AAC.1
MPARACLAGTSREPLCDLVERQAIERDKKFAVGAIVHQSLSIRAPNGMARLQSHTGTQMGLTLAPRDFNDIYNEHVEEWVEGEHEHGHHELLETEHPITNTDHSLSLSLFMDDIAKIHVITEGSSSEVITHLLNDLTHRLEKVIERGGWSLNAGKTNHLLCFRGEGSYQATQRLRMSKELHGAACREVRALGPFIPSDQGLLGEVSRRCVAAKMARRPCGAFGKAPT